MIQAVKDCDLLKLSSILSSHGSVSRKELNYCLLVTAQSGTVGCLKCLLNCDILDVNVTNSLGKTPLMLSAENGKVELLDLLLANKRCRVDQRGDGNEQTALHHAAKATNFECARRLLEHGANASLRDSDGNTPLLLLASLRMPNLALMKLLATDKNIINAQNKKGRTALHLTSSHAIGTELLLASGADPDIQDSTGNTALHMASIEGLDTIVVCLVTYNCNVNICNKFGKLPLHYLAMKGHEACIELISKVGGDLNLIDKDGKSPLMHSIENKRFKAFVSLLSNNCVPDNALLNPLEVAFKMKLYVEVMLLLLVGCDVKPLWRIVGSADDLMERLEIASKEDYDEDDRLIDNNNHIDEDDDENIDDNTNQSNMDYLDWSLRYITHPPTLKHLCRLSIRRLIRTDGRYKTLLLPSLPMLLQDYTLFKGRYNLYHYIQKEHLKARI